MAMHKMQEIFTLTYRNLTASLDRMFIIWHIVVPLVVIFAGGYSFATLVEGNSVKVGDILISYPAFLATGIVAYNVLWTCVISGNIFYNDKVNGMFDQILAMPFTKTQYLIATLLTIILIGIFGALAVIIIGIPTFVEQVQITPIGIIYTAISLILCSILFSSIVILVSVLVTGNKLSFQTESGIVSGIFGIGSFVSSISYPTYAAPEPLRTIFYFNPMTYVADISRAGMFSQIGTNINIELIILVILSILAFYFAFLSIKKIEV